MCTLLKSSPLPSETLALLPRYSLAVWGVWLRHSSFILTKCRTSSRSASLADAVYWLQPRFSFYRKPEINPFPRPSMMLRHWARHRLSTTGLTEKVLAQRQRTARSKKGAR